jgi:arsenate reductase
MTEMGIDISSHHAKSVKEFLSQEIDYVVTVCDGAHEVCPFFPGGKEHMHKSFDDPSRFTGEPQDILDGFRRVRNEIAGWIKQKFGQED